MPVAIGVVCQHSAPWGPSFPFAGLQVPLVALWPLIALAVLTAALFLTRDAARARRGLSRHGTDGRR